MTKADPEQVATQQAGGLLARARTVSGDNIRGTARIVSLAELKTLMRQALEENGGVDEEEMQRQEARLREEFAQAEAGFGERERALQERLRELEAQLAEADQNKQLAVEEARAALQGRIGELETILANDDARSRAAFLEEEVKRLNALIDRYETDLEAITCIDIPDLSAELATVDVLLGKSEGELKERLDFIKLHIGTDLHALQEGVRLINEQKQGSVYACYDLLEKAVAVRHLRHEVLSIAQAIG